MLFLRFILVGLILLSFRSQAQYTTDSHSSWFIELPLRFTHLQNEKSMLSGIKIGKQLRPGTGISLSIYHSFYPKSFKPEIGIPEFEEQPRLFINGVAITMEQQVYNRSRFSLSVEILLGWGFMTYQLKQDDFSSTKVHYPAMEPALISFFKINKNTSLGFGLSYRPVFNRDDFYLSSPEWSGYQPVYRDFPNGMSILVVLKGEL